ncbi:unnamed protein product [Moneuplotes crassus]|uniref:Uncharacterized protein n=1 Tax=Euplotes crassus TaxID=5936 RepID=A0AAD1U709_EUPCR|nr:unnamed protein product [Moneuplotes crassus]
MNKLSDVITQIKKGDMKELAGRDIQLQVIEVYGMSKIHSQTASECLNLTLWDGVDQIQGKIITDILNNMTQTIELYSIIKFNSCCFLQDKYTGDKILMVGSDIEILNNYTHRIEPEEENKSQSSRKKSEISMRKSEDSLKQYSSVKVSQDIGDFLVDSTPLKENQLENEFSDYEGDESDQDQYLPISKISVCHNYQQTDWKIKARVADIFPIKQFMNKYPHKSSRSTFRVLNIVLSDFYTGDEIEGTFYNELIEQFFNIEDGEILPPVNPDQLQANCVYIISGCKVLDSKNTSTVQHLRKLNFKSDSVVKRWYPKSNTRKRRLSTTEFTYHDQLLTKINSSINIYGIISTITSTFQKSSSKSFSSILTLYLLTFKTSERTDYEQIVIKILDQKASELRLKEGEVIAVFNCRVLMASTPYLEVLSVKDVTRGEDAGCVEDLERLNELYAQYVGECGGDGIGSPGIGVSVGGVTKENSMVRCKVDIPSENCSQDHLLFTQKCKSCNIYQDIQEGSLIHRDEFCQHCKTEREFSLEYKIQCSIILETGATYRCVMKNLCAHEILPKPALKLFNMNEDTRREILDACTKCYCEIDEFCNPKCKHNSFCDVILENSWSIKQEVPCISYNEEGEDEIEQDKACYEIYQIIFST